MSYAVRILLVDPYLLQRMRAIDPAIVMSISGLIRGDSRFLLHDYDEVRVSRTMSRQTLRLEHRPNFNEQLEARAVDSMGGTTLFHYCSRCGSRFGQTECSTCNVTFRLDSIMDSVAYRTPVIPDSFVKYAKEHGHTFIIEPPRA